jgi:hypothetical protein
LAVESAGVVTGMTTEEEAWVVIPRQKARTTANSRATGARKGNRFDVESCLVSNVDLLALAGPG